MKKIVLTFLRFTNFKGAEKLSIPFDGSTNIYGANGTYKSTINSGWMWLLTGKDEFDREDHELKNTNKPELNQQGHEVYAELLVNGDRVTLKKIYWEDWQKPKGKSEKVFKGHYTDYFFNDAPCKATDYKKYIEQLIPANMIKLITNPMYFNGLKQDEQRRGLLSICGTISDSEIIDSIVTPENDFGELINALNAKKSIEVWRASLLSRKNDLVKLSKEYTPRIDEAKNNRPEEKNWDELEAEKIELNKKIASLDELITDAGKALNEKQTALNQKSNLLFQERTRLTDHKNAIKERLKTQNDDVPANIRLLESQIKTIKSNISRFEKEIEQKRLSITNYKSEIERLDAMVANNRNNWNELNSRKFEFDESNSICPSCKQPLPAETVNSSKETLLKNFNSDIAKKKAAEVEKSDQSKAEINSINISIEAVATDIINLQNTLSEETAKLDPLALRLQELHNKQNSSAPVNIDEQVEEICKNDETAIAINVVIDQLNAEITAAKEELNSPVDTTEYKSKISKYRDDIKSLNDQLALKAVIEKTDARIAELEREETKTGNEIAQIERMIFQVESYNRAKSNIIETRVNSMFKHVKFRLFEKQVNGEIAETCVCEYNGVPYSTLNTASKMLAGLDVIRTFQTYFGLLVPVFCDNRESVTAIPEIGTQVISLYVSPEDKTLRIEKA